MKFPSFCRLLAAVAPAALAFFVPFAFAQPSGGSAATHSYAASRPITGRYIVVFKASVANPAAEAAGLMQGRGGQLHHVYSRAIKGFAATLPDAALQAIRNNPNVSYVEQDQTVSLKQVSSPQNQATWGLDRIDQADRPLDTQYQFKSTGAGVNAFVLDTGIRTDHVEFSGRLKPGFNAIADTNGTNDCNGHGTHVAGTVGGTTWGVAKGVSLIPVRVLDCAGSGAWSGVIAGIDFVANSTLRPAVANMSLGGGASSAVDAAVAGAVAKGVTVVVAAGNSNADACTVSPAREPSAITVGATNDLDSRTSFSNWGSCLDIFAPGGGITSAWNTSATATNTISGTSMASPHVAGVAALALAANPTATPAAVATLVTSNATANRLIESTIRTGSPNLLVYSLLGSPGSVPQPTAKTVAFKSMSGSATKNGGNWKASAVVTVRDVNTGALVPNATVDGSFSPGGTNSCVTGSNGSCTLSSAAIKNNVASSTTLSGNSVSGTYINYDPSQNSVSQIVISKP
ncbi:S8 family peptidase [Ramlibacter sp. 2FC]|uniref:S8 family peptidase n=1 Tax=Ramlibacter sp. 2FC TaxID=2502188 RepID=UPI0010FA53B8|nr:S8 family peptidase [Ramlibacter sp. 2FC]